jgi:voltage-gated sodium channel
MRKLAEKIVKQKLFEHFIIALILINAVILGMETSPSLVTQYGDYLLMANNIILGVFITSHSQNHRCCAAL